MNRELIRSTAFLRAARRYLKKHPQAAEDLEAALLLLSEDAFDLRLKTHKLKGDLDGVWACSAGYDLRLRHSVRDAHRALGRFDFRVEGIEARRAIIMVPRVRACSSVPNVAPRAAHTPGKTQIGDQLFTGSALRIDAGLFFNPSNPPRFVLPDDGRISWLRNNCLD